MEKSRLLKQADIMIFSNNETAIDDDIIHHTQHLFKGNPGFEFKFPPESEFGVLKLIPHRNNRYQYGAQMGLRLGVSQKWFTPYDWVIRINPDVLIRNSTWILKTMKDVTVDGIFSPCTEGKIHTDFFAVRPRTLSPIAFLNILVDPKFKELSHEGTAHKDFFHLLQNRSRFVPDVDDSEGMCRIRGKRAPVYHGHDSCHEGSMVCDALEGWNVT
jgi:hypothetical protein